MLPSFFDGLLPEGWTLDMVVRNWKLDHRDRMGLLLACCRDCVGAVSILTDQEAAPTQAASCGPGNGADAGRSMSRCLYCFRELPQESRQRRYHPACAQKLFGTAEPPLLDYGLEELYALAARSALCPAVPGVQPKMSLARSSDRQTNRLVLAGLSGDHILKPPVASYPFLPENEAATMKMAEAAGLSTAACGLLPLTSGELVYVTLRMDRVLVGKRRLEHRLRHMEDFCQATEHMTEQKYRGSMELVAKTIRRYSTAPGLDLSRLLDLVLFLFLTGNADMHLKNFSLLHDKGEVRLAPFYDLLSTRLVISEKDDQEELALTLKGKKNGFTKTDFAEFARTINLPERGYERSCKRFADRLPAMFDVLARSFLPEELKQQYRLLMLERAARLDLPVPADLPGMS